MANGLEPLKRVLELLSGLVRRPKPHKELVAVKVESVEVRDSREEVRNRLIVPRVRISSGEKALRAWGDVDGGSMEGVGVREWELDPDDATVLEERLNGRRMESDRGLGHEDGGAL